MAGQILGMSLEEISRRDDWKRLTPAAKQVLSVCFTETDFRLVDAVAKVHPTFDSAKVVQVAENLLAGSRALIEAHIGRQARNVRRLIGDDVQEPDAND